MPSSPLPEKVRTIFLSDLHLGYRFSTGANCLYVLNQIDAEKIYFVGDNFDEVRLQMSWYWTDAEQDVLNKLIECHSRGVEVYLLPGNHDPVFRNLESLERPGQVSNLLAPLRAFQISDTFVYESSSGARWLVVHGDQFDDVESHLFGIPRLGSRIFDRTNWILPRPLVLFLRNFFKMLFARPKQIERNVLEHARQSGFDGVIFGHLHTPDLRDEDGFVVANCGDWLGNESFLVETLEGQLKLFNFHREIGVL